MALFVCLLITQSKSWSATNLLVESVNDAPVLAWVNTPSMWRNYSFIQGATLPLPPLTLMDVDATDGTILMTLDVGVVYGNISLAAPYDMV